MNSEGMGEAASSSCTRLSRLSTISPVTSVSPATSFVLLSGRVATSAIATHRSRFERHELVVELASARLGPGQAEGGLRLVDGAHGLDARRVLPDAPAEQESCRAAVATFSRDAHRSEIVPVIPGLIEQTSRVHDTIDTDKAQVAGPRLGP